MPRRTYFQTMSENVISGSLLRESGFGKGGIPKKNLIGGEIKTRYIGRGDIYLILILIFLIGM